jgi:hypothetical protein
VDGSAVVDIIVDSQQLSLDEGSDANQTSAEMVTFLSSLRRKDALRKQNLEGAPQQVLNDVRLEHPLLPVDHPLLYDDFSTLPPFMAPPSVATARPNSIFAPLVLTREASENNENNPAPVSTLNHPNFPYFLTPGCPLLPAMAQGPELKSFASMKVESIEGTEFNPMLTLSDGISGGNEILFTSVLRKRRKKMFV